MTAAGIRKRRGVLSPACTCAPPTAPESTVTASKARHSLRARPTDVIQLFETDENVARLRPIGRTEHARRVELIDDASGPTIPDLQAALQERRRALLILHHDLGGLAEQLVAVTRVGGLSVRLRAIHRFLLAHRL